MSGFADTFADRWMPEPNTGCMLWTGSATPKGYPTLTRKGFPHYGHHAAYDERHGRGAHQGLTIRHKCDTPCCVNADHLLGGTAQDNTDDMWSRGRARPAKGEAAGRAVLSVDDVCSMRDMARSGMPIATIARQFAIRSDTARMAVIGKTWADVPGAVSPGGRQKGEARHNTVVTAEIVRSIRQRAASGERQSSIAKDLGLNRGAVNHIVKRRNWSHVE